MKAALQERDDPPVWEPRKFPDNLVSGQKVLGDSTYVSVDSVRAGFFFRFPAHVACISGGRVVTWDDIRREKQERQRRQLEAKRRTNAPRQIPVVVWVFYNDPDNFPFYSGWYTYIRGRARRYAGGDEWSINFRGPEGDRPRMIGMVMNAFPVGLLPMEENFDAWMKEFVRTYPWPEKRRREGKAFAWATVSDRRIIKLEPVKE